MQRSFLRLISATIISTCIAASYSSVAAETKADLLKPNDIQSKTATEIVKQLTKNHYRQQELNDSLSSRYLDEYLKTLDNAKNFLIASDIAEFEKYRKGFDDDFKAGKLDNAFVIYNRFSTRYIQRLNDVIALLDNKEKNFDFDADESISIDRKNESWPANKETSDKLWHQHVKFNLLNSMLNGKSLEESKTALRKRYINQLRRIKQQTAEEAFSVMMNSLTTLYDPHTNYLSPENAENFNINMSLSLQGIGATLQSEDDYTKVMSLVPGGPADKEGNLKPNDKIISIAQGEKGEFEDVVGMRLDEVVKKIRGEKNTIVRLEVIPATPTTTENKIITIKRETVKLEDQAAKKAVYNVNNGQQNFKIGLINIPTFYMDFEAYNRRDPNYKSTTRDVYKLLEELHKENVDGIIVDLRENGGGSLPEAAMLTNLFIDQEQPVVQIRHSDNSISRDFRTHNTASYRGPLLVLTNRLSASASEIFAGAIQDYGRGLVVGSTTFGKGSVQTMIPVEKGHGDLKITQAKFYRVSGDSTQHRGVIPDLELPTLFNTKEIGESSYDNALPWDKIHPAPHNTYFNLGAYIPLLKPLHQERMKKDPDLIFIRQQAAFYEEMNNKKVISLRMATRKQEQQQIEQRTLDIENQKRKAKAEPLYASYADYKAKELKKDDDDTPEEPKKKGLVPEKDPYLVESGKILGDFILQLKKTAVPKVANQ